MEAENAALGGDARAREHMAQLRGIMARASPNFLIQTLRLTEALLCEAPTEARNALTPYAGWSALVYALPITDGSLWLWSRCGDRRYLFANYVLEYAADQVAAYLSEKNIGCVDIAKRFVGLVSLVELAALSGLGSRGINNLLLHESFGSWLQLHALLIDIPFISATQVAREACTRCGLCIGACPAEAIRGKNFYPERCARLVASPWLANSKAVAVTSNSYIECAECISSCPIGRRPEGLFSWRR